MAGPRSQSEAQRVQLVVLGELACGGMARVQVARLGAEGELVALKRLLPHLAADKQAVEMFFDEAWMTGSIHHDNVVRFVGCGRDVDGPFLAMELVDGAPLSLLVKEGQQAGEPFDQQLVAHVGREVALGLDAAHALRGANGELLGLIHRDVTPSNVLVGFDGTVKITDFGVARAAGRTSHTATGVLKGKVAYMSPEYARARPIDARSDLYSLGVTLFVAASGRLPFDAKGDLELLRTIVEEPAPALGDLVAGIDPGLAGLIERLLAKKPDERPADAAEVGQQLASWLDARGCRPDELRSSLGSYARKHGRSRRAQMERLVAQARPTGPPQGTPEPAARDEPELETVALPNDGEQRQAELSRPTPALVDEPLRGGTRVLAKKPVSVAPGPISVRGSEASRTTDPHVGDHHRLPWSTAIAAGATVAFIAVAVLWAQSLGGESRPGALARAQLGAIAAKLLRRAEPALPGDGADAGAELDAASSSTDSTASSSPPDAPSTGPKRKPRVVTTRTAPVPSPSATARRCTPSDFDYPSCLSPKR